ncbi:hypothetical protein OOU_Y34scaffold01091g4 [Pyricularia oryzae Y34]|uniref:Uncharacterized protein n=2 Tax=Pyricularia oryzae TaxID=318829 RepID=A0AA97NLY8_PYRO3|nr:hypothetical protein OOU_Y34scaffold01091g4 [Pyricularia oryzae Y34]
MLQIKLTQFYNTFSGLELGRAQAERKPSLHNSISSKLQAF